MIPNIKIRNIIRVMLIIMIMIMLKRKIIRKHNRINITPTIIRITNKKEQYKE